jgi:hypothetical protein
VSRRIAAGPPLRAVAGRGEPGEVGDLVIPPPVEYAAGYGVTARGSLGPTGYNLECVTVTDRETGATLTVPLVQGRPGGRIAASLPAGLAQGGLTRLWRDGRYLAGWAGTLGRPPGLTTIESDGQLADAVLAMRRDRIRIVQEKLAARAGFTRAEVRGYLDKTSRTIEELEREIVANSRRR